MMGGFLSEMMFWFWGIQEEINVTAPSISFHNLKGKYRYQTIHLPTRIVLLLD